MEINLNVNIPVGEKSIQTNHQAEEMLTRFVLEPRAQSQGSYHIAKWLIIKDTATGKYICEGDSRKYKRFLDSAEAYEFLKNIVWEEV